MFVNYIKIALRNFRRHKSFSFINVAGLSVGIACCLLILFYVREEVSFDRFHRDADHIYRVLNRFTFGGSDATLVTTPARLAPLLDTGIPDIEMRARLYFRTVSEPVVVAYGERKFIENGFLYADSTFFSLFSFEIIRGERERPLARPFSVVLSQGAAGRLFGDENPVGKTIRRDDSEDLFVTAVMRDVPANSHIQFDYVASWTSLRDWQSADESLWGPSNFVTYVKLSGSTSALDVDKKMAALIDREWPEAKSGVTLQLQPLERIHLHSGHISRGVEIRGDYGYVLGFTALAALILLVACINYMNLATARSAKRAKEVGVRKVVGAHRFALSSQFIGESLLVSLIAIVLAVGLVEIFKPVVSGVIGRVVSTNYLADAWILPAIAVLWVVVALVAGSYPALVLPTFQPVSVLRGEKQSTRGAAFRKVLVIFQFAVSVFLVAGTLVIRQQLDFLRDKKLGFQQDQILILPIGDRQLKSQYETLKSAFAIDSRILSASAASAFPGNIRAGYRVDVPGVPQEGSPVMTGWLTDPDLFATLGLEIVAGRSFSRIPTSSDDFDYVLNEAALRELGWSHEAALGKSLNLHGRAGRVIGVVRDFHFASLHHAIEPLVMFASPRDFRFLMLKVAAADIPATIAFVEQKWQALAPHRPFEYGFLDQQFAALYREEEQVSRFFSAFTVLAIFIASLGLYGLAAYTAELRTKEVGIRKVLGASVSSIVVMLSRQFAGFVLLAALLATPVAYFILSRWLQNYAYRISLGFLTFAAAAAAALIIALLTVAYQGVRAGLANPIQALRYE